MSSAGTNPEAVLRLKDSRQRRRHYIRKYHSLGFSNGISRCRCLRGYCEGRDSDCIGDPGIVAKLRKQAIVLLSNDFHRPSTSSEELSSYIE